MRSIHNFWAVLCATVMVLAMGAGTVIQAQCVAGTVTVVNPSFEDDGALATGWTAIGASGIYNGTAGGRTPTDGTRMTWKNVGTLYQDTGLTPREGHDSDVGVPHQDLSGIRRHGEAVAERSFELHRARDADSSVEGPRPEDVASHAT